MNETTTTEKGNKMKTIEEQVLAAIARNVLGLETLETRNSDSLDFSDQAVWTLKKALEQAFQAGVRRARHATPEAQLKAVNA